jgi:hypothetical protein
MKLGIDFEGSDRGLFDISPCHLEKTTNKIVDVPPETGTEHLPMYETLNK